MNKPCIGITVDYEYEKKCLKLNSEYLEAIQDAGGIPVIFPICPDEDILYYINKVDGVLLTGGDDIDGRYFGEPTYRYAGKIIPERDKLEISIAKKCHEKNIPVLGICRGMQVMSIAMGGSIYQDIERQYDKRPFIKHKQEAPRCYGSHKVEIIPSSKLSSIIKNDLLYVNSFHHQGVRSVGDGIIVSARSEDELIEGIESQNHPYYIGVQWHPEHMYKKNVEEKRLFQNLIIEGKKYRGE